MEVEQLIVAAKVDATANAHLTEWQKTSAFAGSNSAL